MPVVDAAQPPYPHTMRHGASRGVSRGRAAQLGPISNAANSTAAPCRAVRSTQKLRATRSGTAPASRLGDTLTNPNHEPDYSSRTAEVDRFFATAIKRRSRYENR